MGEKLDIKYVGDIYSEDILLISDVGMTARLKSKDEVIKILNGWIESYNKLKDQLALTEKALELACEMLCGVTVWDNELVFDEARKDCCEYFIERAKEMMKSE